MCFAGFLYSFNFTAWNSLITSHLGQKDDYELPPPPKGAFLFFISYDIF
jgi:hypothetical protein